MANDGYWPVKLQGKSGDGLCGFQIHRLTQQVLMDALVLGDTYGTQTFQSFTREQLQFITSFAEKLGNVCYDYGFYKGENNVTRK